MELLTTSETNPIRILLVDDHPIVRGGLLALTQRQPDMLVVGQAEDGLSAHESVAALRPDVVVMDLVLPRLAGVEATERIKADFPEVKVLALTALDELSCLRGALQAGASGVMLKRSAADELVSAIRCVAQGGQYVDASLSVPEGAVEEPSPRALSAREREVLTLLAAGHTARDMAARLCISVRTLETYRARAMEKLGLKNRADIVRYAASHGWLLSV
jgi:DNA-binding NarL/FixJ family response regulator